MLSDRWIRHQRKQNRPRIEQQHQVSIKDEIQTEFRNSSAKACTTETRKEAPQNSTNLNEFQVIRPNPPPASGKHSLVKHTIYVTDDPTSVMPTVKSNMLTQKNTRDERRFKRTAKGEGISSSGSASPRQQINPPSSPKLKPNRASAVRLDSLLQRRSIGNTKSIWVEGDVAPTRAAVDQSNIASVAIARKRNQLLQHSARPSMQSLPLKSSSQALTSSNTTNLQGTTEISILSAEKRKLNIVLQPDYKPLSQEKIIARVKNTYVELVASESKCIDFHSKPASVIRALTHQVDSNSINLNHEGLQKLIALHHKLLNQYHDFFFATQHPLASIPVRRLASKYAMPARLWRHGIHTFLELLRLLLPASLDYMISFIYLSYSIIALLYETVSVFENTWIECLGDLGRYRMAIEDENSRDREIWTHVARDWYIKASNNTPTVGRLYHHMAILARPSAIEQLFYYSKSLCSPKPFTSARESIQTLFEPILEESNDAIGDNHLTLDYLFVRVHGILFTNRHMESFTQVVQMITEQLYHHAKMVKHFRHQSYHIAIINCAALLEYGSESNNLMKLITKRDENFPADMEQIYSEFSCDNVTFESAQHLSNAFLASIVGVNCLRESDILPYIHVILVFLYHVARHRDAIAYITPGFPWESLATKLNELFRFEYKLIRIEDNDFPNPEDGEIIPLPEDYALRGFVWATDYFPGNWFTNEKIEEQEKYLERSSLDTQRGERILWLAHKISKLNSSLIYRDKKFYAQAIKSQESTG